MLNGGVFGEKPRYLSEQETINDIMRKYLLHCKNNDAKCHIKMCCNILFDNCYVKRYHLEDGLDSWGLMMEILKDIYFQVGIFIPFGIVDIGCHKSQCRLVTKLVRL